MRKGSIPMLYWIVFGLIVLVIVVAFIAVVKPNLGSMVKVEVS